MKIFLLILTILFFVNFVSSLDRNKDCKCKTLSQSAGQKYPWSISLIYKSFDRRDELSDDDKIKNHYCDAIILNENYILTNSYCTPLLGGIFYNISFGSNDIVELYNNQQEHEIQNVIYHPNLTIPNIDIPTNDIALIELKKSLKFTSKLGPACLGTRFTKKYLGNLNTIGHGYNDVIRASIREFDFLNKTRYLKEINLIDKSSEDKEKCLDDSRICAVGKNGKESLCYWDFGNPLMQEKDGRTSVIGIASHANLKPTGKDIEYIACLGNETSVFTRISKYLDFIKLHVGDNYCELNL